MNGSPCYSREPLTVPQEVGDQYTRAEVDLGHEPRDVAITEAIGLDEASPAGDQQDVEARIGQGVDYRKGEGPTATTNTGEKAEVDVDRKAGEVPQIFLDNRAKVVREPQVNTDAGGEDPPHQGHPHDRSRRCAHRGRPRSPAWSPHRSDLSPAASRRAGSFRKGTDPKRPAAAAGARLGRQHSRSFSRGCALEGRDVLEARCERQQRLEARPVRGKSGGPARFLIIRVERKAAADGAPDPDGEDQQQDQDKSKHRDSLAAREAVENIRERLPTAPIRRLLQGSCHSARGELTRIRGILSQSGPGERREPSGGEEAGVARGVTDPRLVP
ncbi:MAG TPA: hypothetical protein VGV57_04780 [Thermoleophilaceae bacterium]|nr:hypothetical protein [Thermoleophilaceae bacterium]